MLLTKNKHEETATLELDWDPEIDTPATIVVIGGGPAGVEATLYARFLGYSVLLLDTTKVGNSLLAWGDREMPWSWGEVTSSLGLAALAAQGTQGLPAADARVTYRKYVELYLLPVARTDLIYDCVQIQSEAVSLSRLGASPYSKLSPEQIAEREFRVLINSSKRGEYTQIAELILDCGGLANRRLGLASGGGKAIGEQTHAAAWHTGKRDILGVQRSRFAGQHTVLWGNDYSACVNACELMQLVREAPGTRLTWLLPKMVGAKEPCLGVPWFAEEIYTQAKQLINGEVDQCVCIPAWGIEAIEHNSEREAAEAPWKLLLQTREDETLSLTCDQFINCGPSAPSATAAGLLAPETASVSADLHSADSGDIDFRHAGGLTTEPHYYVLGEQSPALALPLWDSNANVTTPSVLQQIRDQIRGTFSLVGGRRNLDLYASVQTRRDAP